MAQPLDPLRSLYGALPPVAAPGAGNDPAAAPVDRDGKTFQDVLSDFVKQVDQTQHQYDAAITAVEQGATDNLHQVMIAQSQAQLSLKMAAEVRNKLVEAYKEVMRTQF
jgi:flagellar hook-basal body complex protein FliE